MEKHVLNLPVTVVNEGRSGAVVEPKISLNCKTRYCQIGNIEV